MILAGLTPSRRWPVPPAAAPDQHGLVELRPPRDGHLHLGCGDRYLRGYLNVDLPPAEGVASGTSRPDLESDVMSVACPPASLSEIRLHHLFEHFDRAQALAMLLRWYGWLRPGGTLLIETPDFDACIQSFAERTFEERSVILRHVFGSQEAPWAQHLDGWSADRFQRILGDLGFTDVTTTPGSSDERGLLANVLVTARRPLHDARSAEERLAVAVKLLGYSMNGDSPTETRLFGRWRARLEELARRPEPGA
jgi:hypothetical protein